MAKHPDELDELKDKLKSNLATTALFDAVVFTKHIEAAYAEMLARLNNGLEPDHIYVAGVPFLNPGSRWSIVNASI